MNIGVQVTNLIIIERPAGNIGEHDAVIRAEFNQISDAGRARSINRNLTFLQRPDEVVRFVRTVLDHHDLALTADKCHRHGGVVAIDAIRGKIIRHEDRLEFLRARGVEADRHGQYRRSRRQGDMKSVTGLLTVEIELHAAHAEKDGARRLRLAVEYKFNVGRLPQPGTGGGDDALKDHFLVMHILDQYYIDGNLVGLGDLGRFEHGILSLVAVGNQHDAVGRIVGHDRQREPDRAGKVGGGAILHILPGGDRGIAIRHGGDAGIPGHGDHRHPVLRFPGLGRIGCNSHEIEKTRHERKRN